MDKNIDSYLIKQGIEKLSEEEKKDLLIELIGDNLDELKTQQQSQNPAVQRFRRYLAYPIGSGAETAPEDQKVQKEEKSQKELIKEQNHNEFRRIVSLLRARRIQLDYSQKEISEKAGASYANISALERGTLVCSAETLIGYIRAVDYRYGWLDQKAAGESPIEKSRNVINPKLLDALSALSEEDQEKVLAMVKTLWS